MKTTILSRLGLLAILLPACLMAQGDSLTGKRLQPFSVIQINGAGTVYLTQKDEYSIRKTGDRQAEFSQSGNKLVVNTGKSDITYITFNKIDEIQSSGSADVYNTNIISNNQLRIALSGAGDINLEINTKALLLDVSGAADLTLRGVADTLKGSLSGAGDLKAYKLKALVSHLDVSGAGDAKIWVTEKLMGKVSGAGTLYYIGEPEKLVQITGAGKVKKSNGLSGDTTRLSFGKKNIIIIDKNADSTIVEVPEEDKKKQRPLYQSIYEGFEIGINGLVDANGNTRFSGANEGFNLNYNRSFAFRINVWEKGISLYDDNIFLTTGLGLAFNNFNFSQNTRLVDNGQQLQALVDSLDYKKSKLRSTAIEVPLLLCFRSNGMDKSKRQLGLAAGVVGRWNFGHSQKIVFSQGGSTFKNKIVDDFQINPFALAATARLHYGSFVVFANYDLTRWMIRDKAPELYTFSAGLRIGSFWD